MSRRQTPKAIRDVLRQMPEWQLLAVEGNTRATVEHPESGRSFTFTAHHRIDKILAEAEKLAPGTTRARAGKQNRHKSVKAREREEAAALEAKRRKFAEQREAQLTREATRAAVLKREDELSSIRSLMRPGG